MNSIVDTTTYMSTTIISDHSNNLNNNDSHLITHFINDDGHIGSTGSTPSPDVSIDLLSATANIDYLPCSLMSTDDLLISSSPIAEGDHHQHHLLVKDENYYDDDDDIGYDEEENLITTGGGGGEDHHHHNHLNSFEIKPQSKIANNCRKSNNINKLTSAKSNSNTKKTYETTCEPVYHSPNTNGSYVNDKSQSPRITSSTEIILVNRRPDSASSSTSSSSYKICENNTSSSSSSPSSLYSSNYTNSSISINKRNERERNRVKLVNIGFQTLRQHIPNGCKNKMSKVETLRSAVKYIRLLQSVLDEDSSSSLPQSIVNGDESVSSLTNFMCLKNLENCISYHQ